MEKATVKFIWMDGSSNSFTADEGIIMGIYSSIPTSIGKETITSPDGQVDTFE